MRRSLWLSGCASALGALFFTTIQGSVFNFYLEDLGLRGNLGFFLGLASLAGLGSLAGTWLLQRFGCRRGLFLWGVGGSRLLWLLIGAIPVLWPDWKGESLRWPLAGLVLLFFVTHALGGIAWLSWMSELVPAHLQGRYWGLRQMGCSAAAAIGRLGFGWFLDLHHHPQGYLAVYVFAVVVGGADALLFLGVEHRHPRRPPRTALWADVRASLADPALRRLSAVYLIWTLSNCLMGATLFRFLRGEIHMGILALSTIETVTLCSFTAFSFLWGQFSERHGHRGALALCLILQGVCPVFYLFAGPGDWHYIGLAWITSSFGFCGINLFMYPMLIGYTRKKGHGRAAGMAAFTSLMGLPSFVVFWLTDSHLCPALARLTGAPGPDSRPVFLAICAICMAMRLLAARLVWTLPEQAEETAPGAVIRMFMTTNPLRAAMHMARYVTFGPEEGEEGPFAARAVANGGGGTPR